MKALILIFAVFSNVLLIVAVEISDLLKSLLLSTQKAQRTHRRQWATLGIPRNLEDLPGAEPIHPGHTLIRPSFGMLKSSVKYPQRASESNLVYGNADNVGITFGKTPDRLMYSGFRKANANNIKTLIENPNLLASLGLIKNHKNQLRFTGLDDSGDDNKEHLTDHSSDDDKGLLTDLFSDDDKISEEDKGIEELDDDKNFFGFRRRRQKSKYISSSRESDTSSDFEKNLENPFTTYKNKYKQNWLWNHVMDGDHVNISPFAPKFGIVGPPSSTDMFFARKWWYYNQDDYKPFR